MKRLLTLIVLMFAVGVFADAYNGNPMSRIQHTRIYREFYLTDYINSKTGNDWTDAMQACLVAAQARSGSKVIIQGPGPVYFYPWGIGGKTLNLYPGNVSGYWTIFA